MDLKMLTDKELQNLIYEYTHEIHDKRFMKKLQNELKRRNLEE